jgi:hypothetical protein
MQIVSLKMPKAVEGKQNCRVEVSNRLAASEDLNAEMRINSALATTEEKIRIPSKEHSCYYELKKHRPWFGERCSYLLDRRKQTEQHLNRPRTYFPQLLNVHDVSDVRQKHLTANPLVPGPRALEVEIAIAKFKFPGSDQISAELIQSGDETLVSAIYKPINCIWNKEKLPLQWKEHTVHKKSKKSRELSGISLHKRHSSLKVKSINR